MTETSKNPFRPGAGRVPAHMGHRPEVEGVLSRFLQTLRDGRPDTELGFLYGPRGNGKTVLLQWLHAEARKGGEPSEKIVLVELSSQEIDSPALLTRGILRATYRLGYWTSMVTGGRLGIPGLVSAQITAANLSRPLAEILSKKRTPLLLTLDEAHEAPPEMLGALLNAVQQAGRVRPIAAVFAGTPGLETKLLGARASFWSRGKQLPVGLLPKTSAREVLARPFRDAGLEADDDAVAQLATAADNYPYFLQLYGEAVWDVVKGSGGRIFLPEHVAPALVAADGQKQRYYRNRFDEFDKVGMLPLARRVAEAFIESAATPAERHLPNATLDELLAGEGGYDSKAFLLARGYVWRDASGAPSWTPGIPSLMDYMIKHIPAP